MIIKLQVPLLFQTWQEELYGQIWRRSVTVLVVLITNCLQSHFPLSLMHLSFRNWFTLQQEMELNIGVTLSDGSVELLRLIVTVPPNELHIGGSYSFSLKRGCWMLQGTKIMI